jgi:hypothetical protein
MRVGHELIQLRPFFLCARNTDVYVFLPDLPISAVAVFPQLTEL